MRQTRIKTIFLVCLLFFLPALSVFASGETEKVALILGSQEKYFHRALARAMLIEGSGQEIDSYVYYIEKDSTLSKIQTSINEDVAISAFELETETHVQEVNELTSRQTKLSHYFYENTLLTFPFISGQIFLHAVPQKPELSIFPWAFVGLQIDELAQTQLELARKTPKETTSDKETSGEETSGEDLYIHVFALVSEKESLFQKTLLQSIQNRINENESIFVHRLADETRKGVLSYLETTQVFQQKRFSVIALEDEVAIGVGIFLQKNDANAQERQVIGFGGSEEVRLAIQENSVDASIVPDYQDYAKKIITSSQKLQKELARIRIERQELETYQSSLAQEYVSFEVIEKD